MADLYLTNAQLTTQIANLLSAWNEREAQFRNWVGGSPTGGPNANGAFPLSDASGVSRLVLSPSALASSVSGPAALSVDAANRASASAAMAEAKASAASSDRSLTVEARVKSEEARNLAKTYQDQAGWYWSQVVTKADQVTVQAGVVVTSAQTSIDAKLAALIARDEAQQAQIAAAASAQAAFNHAASGDTSLLATKAELAERLAALVGSSQATMDTLQEIGAALGNDPNFATTMLNQLAGKADLSHVHYISDVTGLQAALNARAQIVHAHVIADVIGLQAALDGKQPAGSYSSTGHGHLISEVAGLQFALDGKQPIGSYAAAGHSHDYLPTSGGNINGNVTLRNASPTLFLRDTDHLSAMIHCNANQLYILRGEVDSDNWTAVGGHWPLVIDLSNNNATFGSNIYTRGAVISDGPVSSQGNPVWHSGNDGPGSGLNADLLRGLIPENFIRSYSASNPAADRTIVIGAATAQNDVWSSPLEIREVGYVGNAQGGIEYSPGILFHWGNVAAASLRMRSDGNFMFQAQGGGTRGLLASNVWVDYGLYRNNRGAYLHMDEAGASGGRVIKSASQPSGMVPGDIWLQPV